MKSLKRIVQTKLLALTALMMVLILIIAVFFQIMAAQAQARSNAEATFSQVRQIIAKSSTELEATQKEYEETCLLNAEAIAYIVQVHPEILGNVEEFRQLAYKLEVDEIHIFDDTGRIFTGTHPEYFNFTFDSGEQMNFFKGMLTDKSLRLCQPITPNTAEGKLVQYSALWSSDGKYIVQVGMYPDAVLEMTEKNELSYIFSLLHGNPGVSLYAARAEDGVIIGSPAGAHNDKSLADIGLSPENLSRYEKGTHTTVSGVDSFCVFENADGTLLGYVISQDQLYSSIGTYTVMLALCLLVIATMLVVVVQRYTDRYIIGGISATNKHLRSVASGNLDERVDVQSSREFSELSGHINTMIRTLLAETDKMSLVLNHTNLRIGVYEYNTQMKNVRYTEHIPEILGVSQVEMARLAADYRQVEALVERLRRKPVEGAENTYRFRVSGREVYIKLEEITDGSAVLGIVMDVTEDTVSRMRAESERDHDLLTGLFNRRGMERRFEALFDVPSDMGCGAIIMVDSDGLKQINDTYGHAVGDIYLKRLAELLRNFRAPHRVVARVGGDEFVLLIYGYPHDRAVEEALRQFDAYRTNAAITLTDDKTIPLQFSYGFELTRGRADHAEMLALADERMYECKRLRKQGTGDPGEA